eukprot:TRINITY_DN17632_c0_g1_i1.p1 TRINITY_DN17632_c0_g1~~TRINITY_DN17632_c0_g1_i1.p1  ORF type:complete len:460 (-),score=97.13 TRINITY_DN17632_c0_g1_i1:31-1380(-)
MTALIKSARALVHTILPFNPNDLEGRFDYTKFVHVEIQEDKLYTIISKYLTTYNDSLKSYYLPAGEEEEEESTDAKNDDLDTSSIKLGLGLGLFFCSLKPNVIANDEPLWVLSQAVGRPTAQTYSGPRQYHSMILFAQTPEKLVTFIEDANDWASKADPDSFHLYTWSFKYGMSYWELVATKKARPVDSVVLPTKLKELIMSDIEEFLSPETVNWYRQHGISHKRCYMFYGPPGSGKTSMIQAIAGRFRRSVCFLQACHPKMTDTQLSESIIQAPSKSIIVLEDIDALFGKDRQTLNEKTPLTFTGLLNALDGVANPDGQIFVLTTNHIDRLDSALVRAGRVDVKALFENAGEEQIKDMFLRFYPGQQKEALEFVEKIKNRFNLSTGELAMASLQLLFIKCRNSSASETIAAVDEFADDVFHARKIVIETEHEKKVKEKEEETEKPAER